MRYVEATNNIYQDNIRTALDSSFELRNSHFCLIKEKASCSLPTHSVPPPIIPIQPDPIRSISTILQGSPAKEQNKKKNLSIKPFLISQIAQYRQRKFDRR